MTAIIKQTKNKNQKINGSNNDRAVLVGGQNHIVYAGAGNDDVSAKNTQGDKFSSTTGTTI